MTTRKGVAASSAWLLSIALIGCSGAGVGSPVHSTSSFPTVGVSGTPMGSPLAPSPSAAAGPAILPVFNAGNARPLAPGTYTTGARGFFPGLTLTIPAGWSASETDAGELQLNADDRAGDALLLWLDVAAVVTNNRAGTVGRVLTGVGTTASDLVNWLTTTSDFAILAKPRSTTVGNDVKGVQLTLTTSNTANFAWNDCPNTPHCVAIFTKPGYWGTGFYGIGGPGVSRIFVATLHFPTGDHTFFVVLDAVSVTDLPRFATEAQSIIDSLIVPSTFAQN
jgi:hypothetical protein